MCFQARFISEQIWTDNAVSKEKKKTFSKLFSHTPQTVHKIVTSVHLKKKNILCLHKIHSYPILEVELYDTNGKSDINIGMALIENGLATREDWEDIQDDTQETSSSEGGRGSRSNRGGSNQAAGGSRSETSSGVVEVKYTPV